MSAVKRKVYGASFKDKVGLEAIQGLKAVNEMAQKHNNANNTGSSVNRKFRQHLATDP